MTRGYDYLRVMPLDDELKRLHWRAHHRGTKEADLMIGGFFDAQVSSWDEEQRATFDDLLNEQDVDIMAWALGTAEPPERFAGPMIEQLRQLNYIKVSR